MSYLQLAEGSVIGRSHVVALGNNQDAHNALLESDLAVVAVCDGCSDSEHSEVGAWQGARYLTRSIIRAIREGGIDPSSPELWERVHQDLIFKIQDWANDIGGSRSNAIRSYFLFTTLVGVITPKVSVFASIGDGVIIVNGEVVDLPAMEGNKPPYVALALTSAKDDFPPETLRFKVHFSLPTSEMKHFLIGTDGVKGLIALETAQLPGKRETVGHISRFWLDDYIFANPDAVRRELAKLNKPMTTALWDEGRLVKHNGLLSDDTTLVTGRMTEVP